MSLGFIIFCYIFFHMLKVNKYIPWVGVFTAPLLGVSAEMLEVSILPEGNRVRINIQHRDNLVPSEESIVLEKMDNGWQLINQTLQEGNAVTFPVPTKAQLSIDNLSFVLSTNGDLALSGVGDRLQLGYGGKCLVERGGMLQLESFFLHQASTFENAGTIIIHQDWLCLVSTIKNAGTITIQQGWQVAALKTFTNTNEGKFFVQRVDMFSPATTFTNNGNIACILDWNAKSCVFNNIGGSVQIGGNCTLQTLNNNSEQEPAPGEFRETQREFFTDKGAPLNVANAGGNVHQTLTLYDLVQGRSPYERRSDRGNGQCYLNYRRIIHEVLQCNLRTGQVANFVVQGNCVCKNGECKYSKIFIGHDFIAQNYRMVGIVIYEKTTLALWKLVQGPRRWHRRDYFIDAFVNQQSTLTPMPGGIKASLEILGTVTGKVETFANGKPDTNQPGAIHAMQDSLDAYQQALVESADKQGIPLEMVVDQEEYEAGIEAMKTNPSFAEMVRIQVERSKRSAMVSSAPSRPATPPKE